VDALRLLGTWRLLVTAGGWMGAAAPGKRKTGSAAGGMAGAG